MPKVGKKKFPYTAEGKAAAKAYAKGEKMESKSEKMMEMKKGMKQTVKKSVKKKKMFLAWRALNDFCLAVGCLSPVTPCCPNRIVFT